MSDKKAPIDMTNHDLNELGIKLPGTQKKLRVHFFKDETICIIGAKTYKPAFGCYKDECTIEVTRGDFDTLVKWYTGEGEK